MTARKQAYRLGALAKLEEKRQAEVARLKRENVERIMALRRIKQDEAMQCPIGCGGSVHPEHELDCMTVDEWDSQTGEGPPLPEQDWL